MDFLRDNFKDLSVSAIGGVFATITVFILQAIKIRLSLRNKFSRLAGSYEGFGLDNDLALKSKPQSKVQIVYKKLNILKITLTEKNGNIWEGDITIDPILEIGKVVWRYTKPDELKRRFGFKELIINKSNKKIEALYLIGEKQEGYGKEILLPIR